ncbi:S1 RNA-binding domain-containing protein [Arthrobacter bambusae]|uniref:S1 RNA-binding domain-containing protein n=1 Tax=Arthrobacter bambusae TaxID=1338426 RepID=UPI002784FEF9|nr:S1 RNA-binding domain-containing protein [Arthrobacter bambusae]MDQ0212153.1 polyribonucleotide nucleotidyltransferase [Arthrobacter bambusae]MDQ0236629.1 polyribonucleotide nucleotidyltransferase [Arthrobacter bambusae]
MDFLEAKRKDIDQIELENSVGISVLASWTLIRGLDASSVHTAMAAVAAIARPPGPQVGEYYLGSVVKVTEEGAVISLAPGKEGLLRDPSSLFPRVNGKSEDTLDVVGVKVAVEVTQIDDEGKISLAALKA